jgi:hypothetical protein
MKRIIHTIKQLASKLHMLDWVVILVAAGGLLFLITSSIQQTKWITIEFKVNVNFPYAGNGEPPYWIAEKIRQGDAQYDNVGQKNLIVLDVKSWGFQSQETWVRVSVKTKYKSNQNKYTYQYQPLEIGRPIDITVNGTNVRGIVTFIQGFSDTRTTYDITVKARILDNYSPYSAATLGVDPWVANAINKGQVIRDASEKPVAEILDKEVRPAERIVTTSDGRILVGQDPLKKDVFLTIKLKTIQQNGTYLFLEDKPVKIGWNIPLYLPQMMLSPVVTEIL